jgi:hypothetical protein
MTRRFRFRRPSASGVAAVIVLLPILGLVLASIAITHGGGSAGVVGNNVVLSTAQIRAQPLGASKSEIEARFGKGSGALDRGIETGVAVEPMDATCTYYRAAPDNFYDVGQFCFRGDKLVSRRAFFVPRS